MSNDMKSQTKIAVLIGLHHAYGREVFRGIRSYAHPGTDWVIRCCPDQDDESLRMIREWQPAGIIAHIGPTSDVVKLKALGIPIVVTGSACKSSLPSVAIDDVAIGKLAAEHLMNLGLTYFGFFGHSALEYSRGRQEGFFSTLQQREFSCLIHDESRPKPGKDYLSWRTADERMRKWLAALPKPAGVLAYVDTDAIQLAENCLAIGIQVPEEVTLMGVDNDEALCLTTYPPLTSVACPLHQLGYEAAAMLERLMNAGLGTTTACESIVLPPTGVIIRKSTEMLAIEDPIIAKALRYIREHSCAGLRVDDLIQIIPMSRRAFERRFAKLVGRSPLEEIYRCRIDHAKLLLRDTHLPMPEVAEKAGFSDAKRLSAIFKEKTGQSPTSYRKQHQTF